jgi:hypothetical protein
MGRTRVHLFCYGSLRNSLIFLNKFLDFLSVHIVSCSDRPSRTWLVVQVHISTAIPQFSNPMTHSTYDHNIFPIESQYLLLHFDGNFIFVGQKLGKSLLLYVLQCSCELVIHLEQNTAHTTTFPKPYHMLNWRPRNSEEAGTNKALRSHSLCKIHVCAEALLSEHTLYFIPQTVALLSYNGFPLWSQ